MRAAYLGHTEELVGSNGEAVYRDVSKLFSRVIAGHHYIAYQYLIPVSRAKFTLSQMAGLDANWEEFGSEPPNTVSQDLASSILRYSYILDIKPDPYAVASAEGGVGVVYRSDRAYSAFECLNDGSVWMLWYETGGESQSKQISCSATSIQESLQQIEALHANA